MTILPGRMVLERVPQIKFYDGPSRCPEDICLPSVLRAITEYLGDPDYGCNKCRTKSPACQIACAYAYFVGVTGAAFHISWKEGWSFDNQAPVCLDADAAVMEKHAFHAIGYSFEMLLPGQREQFLPRIAESLQRGMPVISYGVFGPPEAGLITGYDNDGETILGWDFFQTLQPAMETEATGYYRKRNWAQDTQSVLIIGDKGPRPPLKETYRAALEFALKIIHAPEAKPGDPERFQDRRNGLTAYDAWADHLMRDEDFQGDEAVLRERFEIHNQMVGMVAEARWYGSQFLVAMTEHTDSHVHRDAIEPILNAAALYAGDHALMWKLWDLAGGLGSPEAWKYFADPAIRRRMVPLIKEAQNRDQAAADNLERAVRCWH